MTFTLLTLIIAFRFALAFSLGYAAALSRR
jgi:hypothetical protein